MSMALSSLVHYCKVLTIFGDLFTNIEILFLSKNIQIFRILMGFQILITDILIVNQLQKFACVCLLLCI